MKTIFLIFLIEIGFQFCGVCQTKSAIDTEQILQVEYISTGSEMGGYFDFKITKDSIKYFGYREKTDTLFWKKLVSSINLSDFDTAPHAKSVSVLDGIDNILRIKTTKRTHNLVLTDNRADYINIIDFINFLSLKLKEHGINIF